MWSRNRYISFLTIAGLKVASDYVKSNPKKYSLLVALDLSSPHMSFDKDIVNLIQLSLFSDGCSAVLLGGEKNEVKNGFEIIDELSMLLENSEDGIELKIDSKRIHCDLSKNLGKYIEENIQNFVETLIENKIKFEEVDYWACHPGGPRIINAVRDGLKLKEEQLEISNKVLKENGNQLSTAIFFVLELVLKNSKNDKNCIAFSFSPGVGVEGVLLKIIKDNLN
jgi:alpha-pyrone synthase